MLLFVSPELCSGRDLVVTCRVEPGLQPSVIGKMMVRGMGWMCKTLRKWAFSLCASACWRRLSTLVFDNLLTIITLKFSQWPILKPILSYTFFFFFWNNMCHRVYFWYQISSKILIFWDKGKKITFGSKFLVQGNKNKLC